MSTLPCCLRSVLFQNLLYNIMSKYSCQHFLLILQKNKGYCLYFRNSAKVLISSGLVRQQPPTTLAPN